MHDEDYRLIPLHGASPPGTRGQGPVVAEALVSVEDYEKLAVYRWRLRTGYAMRWELKPAQIRHMVCMHREILGLIYKDGIIADHINRNRLDNRRCNLRVIPDGTNQQNQGAQYNSTSSYRGVSWDSHRCKWQAKVKMNKKSHMLGRFDNELEAAKVASNFRKEHMPYANN